MWDPKKLIRQSRERRMFLFELYLVFSKEVKDSNGKAKYLYKMKMLVSNQNSVPYQNGRLLKIFYILKCALHAPDMQYPPDKRHWDHGACGRGRVQVCRLDRTLQRQKPTGFRVKGKLLEFFGLAACCGKVRSAAGCHIALPDILQPSNAHSGAC